MKITCKLCGMITQDLDLDNQKAAAKCFMKFGLHIKEKHPKDLTIFLAKVTETTNMVNFLLFSDFFSDSTLESEPFIAKELETAEKGIIDYLDLADKKDTKIEVIKT